MMYYATYPLTISELNDYETDMAISGDDDAVHCEGCTIGHLKVTQQQLVEIMGRAAFEDAMEEVAAWWWEDGLSDARRDAAEEDADWRYRCRRDEGDE